MKKTTIHLLVLVLSLAAVLAGCSGNNADNPPSAEKPDGTGDSAAGKVTPVGTLPIVEEPITLKVLMKGNSLVEDWETNEFTKWLEEKTNINLDFQVTDEKTENANQQLNLILASGDLPDVIIQMGISPAQQMIYGQQGIFVPFNDLIEQYGENTKKIFEEMPEVKPAITAPDGNIYSLPYINECYHCSMNGKMYVYKPWLDKLGLKEPTTTEEFYQMLKAFKEQDPNGNGKADEIPMSGSPTGTRTSVDIFLMNSFIYNDGNKRMIVEDGKIDVVYNKPEWKEGLKYLHKLYAEGLIAPQSLTQDANSLKTMAENPGVAILGATGAHSPSTFTIVEGESNRWLEYQPIAPLKGPNGFRKALWNPYDKIRQGHFVMTSANKYPEATMRLADLMYTLEANLWSNFGAEGKSWEWAKPGDKARGGADATYRLLVPFGRVQNESWAQHGPNYRTDKNWYAAQAIMKHPDKEEMYYNVTKEKYEPYKPDMEQIVPPLFFPAEDAAELAELDKTINDYFSNMTARFISGDADIDAEWDNYVNTLEQMNLKRYLEIYQKAYDSMYKK